MPLASCRGPTTSSCLQMGAGVSKMIHVLEGDTERELMRFHAPQQGKDVLDVLHQDCAGRLKAGDGAVMTAADVLKAGTYRFYRVQGGWLVADLLNAGSQYCMCMGICSDSPCR